MRFFAIAQNDGLMCKRMKQRRRQSVAGFTLVELMVALMVASVVLSAVATLAYATCSASEATDQMGREQAQLQHVCVRVNDLIKRANYVHIDSEYEFWLWHDKNADGNRLSMDEWTRIAKGSDNNTLTIGYTESYTQCENITFDYYDWKDGSPRMVVVSFDMEENGQTQNYSINAHLRVSDDY